MRWSWLFAALVACGGGHAPPVQPPMPAVPRLLAPLPLDADAHGAAYLNAVALALQPAWHQFLEDCRLRLPLTHPLNAMGLTATAELAIDAHGQVEVRIGTSGNRDFDAAVRSVIADASPLARPPREVWSDDDRAHLRWTFARDRRQAGPATAQVVDVSLPVQVVVERRISEHDLGRAAQRILREKPGADREHATQRLFVAALHQALDSSDGAVRRSAIEAVGRAHVDELAPVVRSLIRLRTAVELRLTATMTSAALRDDAAVPEIEQVLTDDLLNEPRLALADTRALVALGKADWAAQGIAGVISRTPGHPTAVQALGFAPLDELAAFLPRWLASRQPRVRAAACAAVTGYPDDVAWPLLARALGDRDATVRAACVEATYAPRPSAPPEGARPLTKEGAQRAAAAQRTAIARLRDLVRDRDSAVRARVIAALATHDPSRVPDASTDPAAEVRAAYASTLRDPARLRSLVDDRDPDVRAAAWTSLAATPLDRQRSALAAHASTDGAPQVRRAAVPAIDDDDVLLQLAKNDDDTDVRSAALVALAGRRGRAGTADLLLERFADAPAGSAERVRTALAWLLAR